LPVVAIAVGLKTSPLEMKKVGGRAVALLVVETLFLADWSSWCNAWPDSRERSATAFLLNQARGPRHRRWSPGYGLFDPVQLFLRAQP
jgi:hypothetical protein